MAKEATRSKTMEDISTLVEVLIKNNSMDDLIAIVSGINETLESDVFTSTMIAYFQTYVEPIDLDWIRNDD